MIVFEQTIPVLRIFDVDKAKEFYVGYLGFQIDWEHHFEANTPLYMQVSRGPLVLHLISAKNYKYLRPGVNDQRPDLPFKSMNVIDPFGNKIRFSEPV